METGRTIPTRQLLLRLTEVLQVPLRARNTMLLTAGYAPLFEETGLSEPEMDQIRSTMRYLLRRSEPFPSILIDRHFNIFDYNRGFTCLCKTFVHDESLLQREPRNLLRLFLNPACCGNSVVNFDEMYTTMFNRLRRTVSVLGSDDAGVALMREIEAYRPSEFATVPEDLPRLIMPLHLRKGDAEVRLFTMVASMGGALNITLQELQLEFTLPVDKASDEFLHDMVRACP